MKINIPQLQEKKDHTYITCSIEYSQGKKEVWYSVAKKYAEFLTTENSDAFLVGLLLLAMKNQEYIYIDGQISERLFYNLNHYFMKIITLLIPSLKAVNIYPQQLNSEKITPNQNVVATGFSGGIDSFCTLIDHWSEKTPDNYKITHLVMNNVGSHGSGGRNLFHQRYQRLNAFAEEFNLPFIQIDSNLHEILEMNFQNTHTTRNISAILALQKLFGKYYYASAHKYADCILTESPDGAVIDPTAIHLLSTETTEFISTGCQHSRVEKTMIVSDFEPSYRYLDVCVHAVDKAENCSQCWKCARTILTLEILGKEKLYNKVFNLDKYYQIKDDYVRSIIDTEKPLSKEVIELGKSKNFFQKED